MANAEVPKDHRHIHGKKIRKVTFGQCTATWEDEICPCGHVKKSTLKSWTGPNRAPRINE